MGVMRVLWMAILSFSLLGCGDGFGSRLTPERTAVAFFEAVYIQRDINQALPYVTDEIASQLKHYRLASQVQRHLFGLYLEPAEVELSDSTGNFFGRNQADILVTIKLSGMKGNQKWRDIRQVKLSQFNKEWRVKEIIIHPWPSNAN